MEKAAGFRFRRRFGGPRLRSQSAPGVLSYHIFHRHNEPPMNDLHARLLNDGTRRQLLRSLGLGAVGASFTTSVFGQGRCRDGYGTSSCPLAEEVATAPIPAVFSPTGWKTVALDHITFEMPDYQKEAAFYIALMGWTLRSDDGKHAVLGIGNWGSAIFRQVVEQQSARVVNFCFKIDPWDAVKIELELRRRGLTPVTENDSNGFESFHVKDPNGWDLQISNGKGLTEARRVPATAKASMPAPFEPTGWKTVWLDHFSYNAGNYKESASFYTNLLGWKETYDEGSQNELMIGDVGDIIIRGGNPNDPNFGKALPRPRPRIDHISFGITPWDTDAVKAELEKRGLRARIDTSTKDDIHVAAFKSYHTTTPNGFDLQISYVTQKNRLALPDAVKPKSVGAK
jgi:catechol 2,3-dioxygenase-like lactoylglutathione lyase family enzyme